MAKAIMHDALRVDAREIGRALAVADGVDGAAEGRAGQQKTVAAPMIAQTIDGVRDAEDR